MSHALLCFLVPSEALYTGWLHEQVLLLQVPIHVHCPSFFALDHLDVFFLAVWLRCTQWVRGGQGQAV